METLNQERSWTNPHPHPAFRQSVSQSYGTRLVSQPPSLGTPVWAPQFGHRSLGTPVSAPAPHFGYTSLGTQFNTPTAPTPPIHPHIFPRCSPQPPPPPDPTPPNLPENSGARGSAGNHAEPKPPYSSRPKHPPPPNPPTTPKLKFKKTKPPKLRTQTLHNLYKPKP